MTLRRLHEWLRLVLLAATAWLWLGGSGVGLLALLLAVRPLWLDEALGERRGKHGNADGNPKKEQGPMQDWRLMVSSKPLRVARLDPHRTLLVAVDGERLEIYRDEQSPADFAALRQAVLTAVSNC